MGKQSGNLGDLILFVTKKLVGGCLLFVLMTLKIEFC
jgi:hypothetical protein